MTLPVIDVHLARPVVPAPLVGRWLEDLSAAERERWSTIRRDADRARYLVGHRLVRSLLAEEFDVPLREVPIDVACSACGRPHGPPELVTANGRHRHISISHAADVVAVAHEAGAHESVWIGVDVEEEAAAEWPDFDTFALTAAEQELLTAAPRPGARASAWVRKEAVLKAWGVGLRRSPSEVELGPALERSHGRVVPDAAWSGPTGAVDWVTPPGAPVGYALAVARTSARKASTGTPTSPAGPAFRVQVRTSAALFTGTRTGS